MSRNSIFFLLGVAVACLTLYAGYRMIEWRNEKPTEYVRIDSTERIESKQKADSAASLADSLYRAVGMPVEDSERADLRRRIRAEIARHRCSLRALGDSLQNTANRP